MPKIKAAESFWMWFMCHEKVYLHLGNVDENEKEEWLDELLRQLHKYSKGISYILNLEYGIQAELIITAEGDFRYFKDVIFLVDMAPVMHDWCFINFIYPTDVTETFAYEDVTLFPDDIYFTARKNNKRLGLLDLQLYMATSNSKRWSRHFADAVNLLLLNLLGETNFTTSIGRLSVHDISAAPKKKCLHHLRDLPRFVFTRNVVRSLLPAMRSQGVLL